MKPWIIMLLLLTACGDRERGPNADTATTEAGNKAAVDDVEAATRDALVSTR
ncbi:hypothetical protein [Sandaracinobacteroides saxicola]|uniref:Uncharacterized protein n=1 Tax=Sandaracinobacteroides saxicola TaxID=2759707 RepID=A0A7G5ILV8_9SPHN|nr:hypothetical protein [Sandaracinobacteroides saxicola]QMW24350.1 hypothetical protein H3309_07830 [Sandaracinobacteroides saxicola]